MTEPAGSDSPRSHLADRYGRRTRGPSRRTGVVSVTILVIVLGAWALWAAIGQSQGAISAGIASYHVGSSHRVTVSVQVSRPSGQSVRCVVSAVASDHSNVGETVVTVPSRGPNPATVDTTVRTYRAAAAAEVGRCRAVAPPPRQ